VSVYRAKAHGLSDHLDELVAASMASRGSDGRFGMGKRREDARRRIVEAFDELRGPARRSVDALERFLLGRRVGRAGQGELAEILHDLKRGLERAGLR